MDPVIILSIAAAIFVGINIGGSSTGVAFGPSVGSRLVSKKGAAGLMTLFAFLGGWTVGRNVISTMGGKIVPSTFFSPTASMIILFFIGGALLISNLSGVPASTSMTAVGAIAGLGMATNSIQWEVMGRIVSWWLVAPAVAFMAGGIIGRYLYTRLDQYFKIIQSDGSLLKRKIGFPYLALGDNTTVKELISSSMVLVIACYMAFSAGASNVANAVAPLIGSDSISVGMNAGILLAVGAMSIGSFTIARKTLDTVGDGITDLPIMASLIVSMVSASIISVLSLMGIPASLAISATMCITGLGWGRATRTVRIKDTLKGKKPENVKVSSLRTKKSKKIGDEKSEDLEDSQLFKPDVIKHVVFLWIFTPSFSAAASYLVFSLI
jgi:PiT family inorganic phosphate transporter